MSELARLLLLLSLAHLVVDAFASIIQPLWPDLKQQLGLADGSIQWAYVFWSLATSLVQLPLAYWGDRYRGRWMIWAGPALAVICLGSVGLVDSFVGLVVLLVLGGIGIAAFHPEAATLAGACAPENRSRAMSLFALGGFLGQAAGPLYSGMLTDRFGLGSLIWSVAWGLPCLALVALGLSRLRPGPVAMAADRVGFSRLVEGKGSAIGLLLATGALRVVPAMGVPLALAFVIKGRQGSNFDVGVAQSVFLAAIGAGGLACAVVVRRANERLVLWLMPLAVVPLLAACPKAEGAVLLSCVGLIGLAVGVTTPVLVSYGQQLLADAQRVANSITMGVTWAVGSAVVAATMAVANHLGRPEAAFYAFAGCSFAAACVCTWLPHVGPRAVVVEVPAV
ncbi:MAG: MFS transporter [Pirellulales bacterium]